MSCEFMVANSNKDIIFFELEWVFWFEQTSVEEFHGVVGD